MTDRRYWFEPKRFGYGAGLPTAWQGWALLLAYVALLTTVIALAGDRPAIVAAVAVPATAVLMFVSARTTRGGWRWRWGEKD